MKKMCFSCKTRPARILKTKRRHYANAPGILATFYHTAHTYAEQGVFCSQTCAADWALFAASSLNKLSTVEQAKFAEFQRNNPPKES